ncbi:unnamed protein product [Phytophthora fragariaefolia]|uniref:Unnamed protein product n=1 Tax=Phytophthora fragariaefolia TaxID=1490495 RepID=A0A9W6TY87_9STRA|nr:unnamed protein product [Phytophthora fragariaefolia]
MVTPSVMTTCTGLSVSVGTPSVTSAGLARTSGMLGGGFTFLGSAGSGAWMKSGIGMGPGAGSVVSVTPAMTASVSVTATWPTVSATFSSAIPNTGAFPAAPVIIPQYSGGGFGMKLDNKPAMMQGSFDLYAVQLETFLTRLNLWGVIENEAAVCASVSDVQFAMMDNIARGAILHGVPTADAELICHEITAQAMWISFVDK